VKRRRLAGEEGASAVEFAIIASLLLLILFGTIQFGIIFNRYQGIQAGAREAARLGSLQDTTVVAIEDRAADSLSIVNPANKQTCSTSSGTPTLAVDKWCVQVFKREAPGGSLTPHTTSTASTPCNAIQPGNSKSVVVKVWYRTRLDIPLWASPQLNVSGHGEFRCE
jgi:Flp pilus assembly protein TadG